MIVYRSKSLRIGKVWFDETPPENGVDIIYTLQRSFPIPGPGCEEFHTIVIDLLQPEEVLFGRFKKDTRYEIRRAMDVDRVACEKPSPSHPRLLEEFCECYQRFAEQKHRGAVDRRLLNLLTESQNLYISSAKAPSTNEPVYHAYYYSPLRVRLLYSASLFRGSRGAEEKNLMGRMNRCLHWNDMRWFKREGIPTYDLGGWYNGIQDEEKLRINKFKEEFGGTIVKNYNCVQGVTLKGKVALLINRHFRKR
jgi:hypothetical protein